MTIRKTARSDAGIPALDPADLCSLPREGLRERLEWIRREILPHAVRSETFDTGLAIELRAAVGLAEKLDRLIALERECCSGIVFDRQLGTEPGQLRLEIHGIDPEAPQFRGLRHTDGAEAKSPGTQPSRLVKAAGAGAAASFVVCCLLPIAATGLLGATAEPLRRLDDPWILAALTPLLGGAYWWWISRGGAARSERGRACGTRC